MLIDCPARLGEVPASALLVADFALLPTGPSGADTWALAESLELLAKARTFRETLALGGTLSGEHGIGVLKAPYLTLEQSLELIALQKRIKAAFDPKGLLNPGKIFLGVSSHRGC